MILKFTGEEIEQVLDGRMNSFRQAISDSHAHLRGNKL